MKDLKKIPGAWFYKTQEVSRRGIPDIILCVAGQFFALELKTEVGQIDKLQKHTLEKIRQALGKAYVVTPSLWGTVYDKLKSLGGR